ncbi:hypothetical protein [Evansella cellulosilytica]|nr:hypothetical protein [Evansella cellulosilytica]
MSILNATYQYQDTYFFVFHPTFLLMIGIGIALLATIFYIYKKKTIVK